MENIRERLEFTGKIKPRKYKQPEKNRQEPEIVKKEKEPDIAEGKQVKGNGKPIRPMGPK